MIYFNSGPIGLRGMPGKVGSPGVPGNFLVEKKIEQSILNDSFKI